MYMGGRHYRRTKRPSPIATVSIPNFPYPKIIFSYLMSQSSGLNIKFETPNGESGNVTMPPDVEPAQTSPITSTAAPRLPPPPTTRPAFSTGLTTPPSSSSTTTTETVSTPLPYIQPGVPSFWVAAIWAMSYVNLLGPIDSYDKLKDYFSKVSIKMKQIMGDGSTGDKNVGALIYFCTVTSILFEPFVDNFTYNYLNVKFPNVFKDVNNGTETVTGAAIYRKVVMVNYFSNHALEILKPNKYPGNGYIPITEQKVMKHAVPHILTSITSLLNDVQPLTDVQG